MKYVAQTSVEKYVGAVNNALLFKKMLDGRESMEITERDFLRGAQAWAECQGAETSSLELDQMIQVMSKYQIIISRGQNGRINWKSKHQVACFVNTGPVRRMLKDYETIGKGDLPILTGARRLANEIGTIGPNAMTEDLDRLIDAIKKYEILVQEKE